MNDFIIIYNDELYHHGVKGMKWGVRRRKRYKDGTKKSFATRMQERRLDKLQWQLKNEKMSDKKRANKVFDIKDAKANVKLMRTADKIRNNMTVGEKLFYNPSNFSQVAANKVINSGMTVEQAKKQTKRNFNAVISASAAITVAAAIASYKLWQ